MKSAFRTIIVLNIKCDCVEFFIILCNIEFSLGSQNSMF